MSHSFNSGRLLILSCALILGACSSTQPVKTAKVDKPVASKSSPVAVTHTEWEEAPQGGGYYLDDGPGDFRPVDLQKIPNAEPFIEPLAKFNLREYTVMGQTFVPQTTLEEPYRQKGKASWYGRKFHGSKTANGEIYDMHQMTAAHPTLPLPSYAKVTNAANGRSVIVRVNDRGPFLRSRIIDLSYAAAFKLGYVNQGSAEVVVEKLTPELIALYKKDPEGFIQQDTLLASADSRPVKEVNPVISASAVSFRANDYPPVSAVNAANNAANNAYSNGQPVYLQVGAFGALPNAENMKNQLKTIEPSFNDSTRILKQDGMFRVFVGPFTNRDQANEAAFLLASKGDVRPVIREGLILP
ncbi:MAG: septal ring lytic transglycosylase RlpA family protein [Limnobacter sp.]|nr:septal ring lytic transglycosylase RlpA family protein [Limnobacter sp.]